MESVIVAVIFALAFYGWWSLINSFTNWLSDKSEKK